MLSPQPDGPEMSLSSVVALETDSAAKSQKPDMRRKKKEPRQSPFKVPDSNIFQLSVSEKEERKEEMRKFLALPIDEKTSHAARMTARLKKELVGEEEEEEEEMKTLKRIERRTVLPKQISTRHELKMAMMRRENISKDSKHDLISMERQKAVLEVNDEKDLSLMTKRSEISRMDKAIAREERQLQQLQRLIHRDNQHFEEFLRDNEKKSVEARTFFEQEAKSKQEKNTEIKKLSAEIGSIRSELSNCEEILIDYKRYKELLFQLSPVEWQQEQKTKTEKDKILNDGEGQIEPDESPDTNGLERNVPSPCGQLPPITETSLSATNSNTQITNYEPNNDSDYEEDPQIYFTDPQQLMDLVTELTEQNLSLIQNSTRVEATLEELKQSMQITRDKIVKGEELLTLQINDVNQRIDVEKKRSNKLKQKVQLHVSLNTEDQDVMLDALGEKVSEVHRCCVDERISNLSTLEKLSNIESRMSLLLQSLESIPEDKLETMKKIKDSERRSRQREEKLREQREKQKERMRRYLERSLADSKKVSGRKLMPRCTPVAQKARVRNVDKTPAEDEIHAYLFTADDIE